MTDAFDLAFQKGGQVGFRQGYNAGFDAGRVRLGRPFDGDPAAAAGPFSSLQDLRQAGPCADPRCGACRVRRDWLDRHGGDYPGGLAVAA